MLAPNVELEVELLGQRRVQKFPYGYLNGAQNLLLPHRFPEQPRSLDEVLAWTSMLAAAVQRSAQSREPAVLALYADFSTDAAERATRLALPTDIARSWVAGRDDDALAEHVREAHLHHLE